jgi:hypothetical protein
LFSALPFDIIIIFSEDEMSASARTVVKTLKVLKMARVLKFIKMRKIFLDALKHFFDTEDSIIRLIFFILIFFFTIHTLACLWIFTGKSNQDSLNWI